MSGRIEFFIARIPVWIWGLACAGYAAAIFFVSSVPSSRIHGSGYLLNLLHAPLFGGLALLVAAGLVSRRSSSGHRLLVPAWFIAVSYAGLDELHQAYVPGRNASLADIMTDALGAGFSLVLLSLALDPSRRDRRRWVWVLVLGAAIFGSAWVAQHDGPSKIAPESERSDGSR